MVPLFSIPVTIKRWKSIMASKALIAARIEARQQIVPLTASDVLTANRNDTLYKHFHENDSHRPDGTCYEHRPNGRLQTWKTRPTEFRLPIKYGLRSYSHIDEYNVGDFHYAFECPVERVYQITGTNT